MLVWREYFKLGATINDFTGIQNSFSVPFEVFIEEGQRVSLSHTEVVKALIVV